MNKPNLDTCTLQEACDYAVFKIVEQGKQCVGNDKKCAYVDKYGNHCAVGWLLDHNDNRLLSCDISIFSLAREGDFDIPELIKNKNSVFSTLQSFHDSDYKYLREQFKHFLSMNIDTSAPQYQKWVEMGAEG